jgi:hypothetical protein
VIELQWLRIGEVDMDAPDPTGIDITPGPGAVTSIFTPIFTDILKGALMAVEFGETLVNETDVEVSLLDFLLVFYTIDIRSEILAELNEATLIAMRGLDLDISDRLQDVCDQITPAVPSNHPYRYFYDHLDAECQELLDNGTIRPFQPNEASEDFGCYEEDGFITPRDAGQNRWWTRYFGQEWYFPLVEDQGCRIGNRVSGVLDRATWTPLHCATATFNLAVHNGLTQGANSVRDMVSQFCSTAGHDALLDLYGDGNDLRELYETVHRDEFDLTGNN